MDVTYKDYLDAKATILAFKKNINFEIDDLVKNDFVVRSNNSIKELCFVMLKKNQSIRTVDLAYNLRTSKQLAHKYKKQFFDSLLK